MKITLVSMNDDLDKAWRYEFRDFKNIKFYKGSILDIKCDALSAPQTASALWMVELITSIPKHLGPLYKEGFRT